LPPGTMLGKGFNLWGCVLRPLVFLRMLTFFMCLSWAGFAGPADARQISDFDDTGSLEHVKSGEHVRVARYRGGYRPAYRPPARARPAARSYGRPKAAPRFPVAHFLGVRLPVRPRGSCGRRRGPKRLLRLCGRVPRPR